LINPQTAFPSIWATFFIQQALMTQSHQKAAIVVDRLRRQLLNQVDFNR
jgi:hypothetical protein